jgi:hypothetical protein
MSVRSSLAWCPEPPALLKMLTPLPAKHGLSRNMCRLYRLDVQPSIGLVSTPGEMIAGSWTGRSDGGSDSVMWCNLQRYFWPFLSAVSGPDG